MATRLQQLYQEEIRAGLTKEFGYKNPMQVPQLKKIVLNMGIGDGSQDSKTVSAAAEELTLIAGQRAVITKAKKSEAGFKIRTDMPIGCKVTLRGQRMFEFLDRLVNVALPRTRDFRGISPKSFDGRGNYNLGVKEQIVFPEINYDKVDKIRGMDIAFITSANSNKEAMALLKGFNLPFRQS